MILETDPAYFDYAATCPPWPEALDEFVNVSQEYFGNPSSVHSTGTWAKTKLLELRKQLCDLLKFHDGHLLLCASASEANTTIIEGHLNNIENARLLIAEDVHDSIWYAVKKLSKSTKVLRLQKDGSIDSSAFEKALNDGITMVCLSHVCHETGIIHPVGELANICHQRQIRLLVDGVQAIGHLPVDLSEIQSSYYTFSGHKLGSPKGIGGVFIRDHDFEPRIYGGKQQWNLRAGTEDLAGLAALIVAMDRSHTDLDTESQRLADLRNMIIAELTKNRKIIVNSPVNGIPGILSLSIQGISGHELAATLSLAGYAVSTGSACQSNHMEPSRILLAMGKSSDEAIGGLRISLGRGNTRESVQGLISVVLEIVN